MAADFAPPNSLFRLLDEVAYAFKLLLRRSFGAHDVNVGKELEIGAIFPAILPILLLFVAAILHPMSSSSNGFESPPYSVDYTPLKPRKRSQDENDALQGCCWFDIGGMFVCYR